MLKSNFNGVEDYNFGGGWAASARTSSFRSARITCCIRRLGNRADPRSEVGLRECRPSFVVSSPNVRTGLRKQLDDTNLFSVLAR